MEYTSHYDSPLGGITLGSDGENLSGLWFDGQKYFPNASDRSRMTNELLIFDETKRWLDVYFKGGVPDFTPSIAMKGSEFQQSVWSILRKIPYAHTVTYGEIAAALAEERGVGKMSARAVGGAVGHNPVSIIIPCHRVVGAGGSLTGYAGGVEKKAWLLAHEKAL